MERIDAVLECRNRTLRTWPGKLLLGPTGKRLFADYLDKVPGFWGRIDFIHKLNLPGLFRVMPEGMAEALEAADAVWYPSHLHMTFSQDGVSLTEDKWITWDDVAVSCQHWVNQTEAPLTLRLETCDVFGMRPMAGGFAFQWDVNSHDFVLTGAITSLPEGLCGDQLLTLGPGETADIRIAAALDTRSHAGERELFSKAREALSADDPLGRQEAEYSEWFRDIPDFSCSDPLLETVWWYRWYLLRNTWAEPDTGNFRHGTFYEGRSHKVVKDLLDPWGHEFTQLIPMSTPMHLIDARWKHNGYECREAMATLLDSMDSEGIFRMMMVDKFYFNFPNFSQWAIDQYLLVHAEDREYVRSLLPGLKKNVRGMWDLHKNDADDLQIVYDHRRTGKEYQPAFWYFRNYPDNARDETGYDWLKRVDTSVYLYLDARGVARLCRRLGDDEAPWFDDLADRLEKQILEKMWDPETGYFYGLHHETGEMARVKCIDGIYPLWAGMTDEQHLPVIDALTDPDEFATGSAFASVTKRCPAYRPQGGWMGNFYKGRDGCMWDGPSWPYTTCIVLDAIALQSKRFNHRYDDRFRQFLREYCWQHFRNQNLREPYLVEHYNAETGEMLSDEVDYNHSFLIDLLIRHVAGLTPTDTGFEIDPVDIGLKQFAFDRLHVRGHNLRVSYDSRNGFRVELDGETVYQAEKPGRYVHTFA